MAEYVKRDAVIMALRGRCIEKYPLSFSLGLLAAADEVSKMPHIEAAPVVHARWAFEDNGYCTTAKCSNCGKYQGLYINGRVPELKYCPDCGAKMDREG